MKDKIFPIGNKKTKQPPATEKTCVTCLEVLPIDTHFYSKYHTSCKRCQTNIARASRRAKIITWLIEDRHYSESDILWLSRHNYKLSTKNMDLDKMNLVLKHFTEQEVVFDVETTAGSIDVFEPTLNRANFFIRYPDKKLHRESQAMMGQFISSLYGCQLCRVFFYGSREELPKSWHTHVYMLENFQIEVIQDDHEN